MGGVENDYDLKKKMEMLFGLFKSKVWDKISLVNENENISFLFKEFNSVLMERTINKNEVLNLKFTFPTFFYFEGIAALIAQLDEFDEFPDIKKVAIKFMVESFQIAPFIAERDVLMSMVYIYMRRKEKQ